MHNFHLDQKRIEVFVKAVHSLQDAGFANPLFFAETEIELLRREATALPFKKAQPLVGKGVYQDFSICFPAPLKNSFKLAAQMLERACKIIEQKRQGLFESEVKINDCAVQSYPAHSRGIGIHKDGLRYRNLVFILTLDGQSELFVCSDRLGTDRLVVSDEPGRLVIFPAPGFNYVEQEDQRPFHGVDNVVGGRLSIGFRQEQC
tara:strand:- start:3018 stop:3629 length:612 start_codon:yes stop_codon:yes gene_type:complete